MVDENNICNDNGPGDVDSGRFSGRLPLQDIIQRGTFHAEGSATPL